MPKYIVTSPDGKKFEVSAPDGASQEEVLSYAQEQFQKEAAPAPKPKADVVGAVKSGAKDFLSGILPGAGAIGSTLVELGDTGGTYGKPLGTLLDRIKARNATQDSVVADATGANPESGAYAAGKLVPQVAGTLGVGGALAGGAKAAGAAVPLVEALKTGGFSAGGMTGLPAWAVRALGGAATGAASTALVEPESAGTGAVVGAAFPMAAKVSGEAGDLVRWGTHAAGKRLMQSAIKPTIKQLQTGDADVAIETLLKYGINPTEKGVEKLRSLVDATNSQIEGKIAGSTAQIDKNTVLGALGQTRQKFGAQVAPAGDLNAIQGVADQFMQHPGFPGQTIPAQDAQKLKQGTYKILNGKYGQLGSAETEAQKALARGLKEEIGKAVPGVNALNAEESKLLKALTVSERRSLMELNKNPMGLAALAVSPSSWALFMADKSAAFKSVAARLVNASGGSGLGLLDSAAANPALRGAGLLTISSDP
jgi:hypothetical protein